MKIAVLLCAYNAEKTLNEAVESVLGSVIPVDLYIVDDGSRMPVSKVVANHPNVHILRQEKNIGLISALNYGLEHILASGKYEFVARMDADDICHPQRFKKQLEFMEAHPDVSLLGTWARFIDEDTKAHLFDYTPPCEHGDLIKALYSNSQILHPTFMFRASHIGQTRYSADYPAAEDYEIIRRVAQKGRLANLPEYLLDYRYSSSGISVSKRKQQLCTRLKIQFKYFEYKQVKAYVGVAKTILLFCMPAGLVMKLKKAKA